MTIILTAILFSISSNLDNMVIGIAYGIKNIQIKFLSNILIAFITTLGTFISMHIGNLITQFISINIANMIGSSIIILLGFYFLIQSSINIYHNNQEINMISLKDSNNMLKYAENSDKDNSLYIDIKEAITVGIGLTLNNVGTGIAASIAGVNLFSTLLFTFIFSISFIYIGILLGNKILGRVLGKFSPLISGIILILLGIIEII